MATPTFPTLVSSNWKMTRSAQFFTKPQLSSSGKRTVAGLRSTPLYKWRLKNGVLQAADTIQDLQEIEGFINTLQGAYSSFYWTDPEQESIAGNPFLVAFTNDAIELQQLSYQIWQVGELAFQQVTF